MGVTSQILIYRPRKGIHQAGGPVTGIVKYAVDQPVRYKEIIISLIGTGKCVWEERKRRGDKDVTIIFTGRENYVEQHMSIHEKGPEGDIILPTGCYERPFTLMLPNNIPSSFKSNTCTIKYKVVLEFVNPSFFSINEKVDTQFDVIGNVQPDMPEGPVGIELEKTLFSLFKKNKTRVHLQTEISNSIFKPGENVQLNYKVTNDTRKIISSVKAELICKKTYTADCGRRKKHTKTLSQCTVDTPSIPNHAVVNLTSMMPLPSFLYTIQNTRIMKNKYSIKVTLRLPMPYINASVMIPIVIGEKYGADDMGFYETAHLVEQPPAYFQVINEGKEDKEND